MGPTSENAGYDVVNPNSVDAAIEASMGPTSENAGYDHDWAYGDLRSSGFNGSDVRERRLWLGVLSACFATT